MKSRNHALLKNDRLVVVVTSTSENTLGLVLECVKENFHFIAGANRYSCSRKELEKKFWTLHW